MIPKKTYTLNLTNPNQLLMDDRMSQLMQQYDVAY